MTKSDLNQFWQKTLSDWEASNLSGAAYCKQQSLVYHRFVYWRQKFNGSSDRQTPAQSRSGFARVSPGREGGPADGLTVSLPGGVSIIGLHAGNIELLGAVLRQL